MMELILNVNFNWVSLYGLERFVKEQLSKVGDKFTKEQFLGDNPKLSDIARLRNNIRFSLALGIIRKSNGDYYKSLEQQVKEYFNLIQQDVKSSRQILAKIVLLSEQFNEVLSFLRRDGVSRRDFIEFLMNKDGHQWSEARYKLSAMALSNMLFELGLVRKIRTKGGRIKKHRGTQMPLIDVSIEKSIQSNMNKDISNIQEPNNKSLGYALLGEALRRLTIEEIKQYFEDIEKLKKL